LAEYHLRVYTGRSELVESDGTLVTFLEGVANAKSIKRLEAIKSALNDEFLPQEIELCRDRPDTLDFSTLSEEQKVNISALVNSMTSEVGRAIIGLAVLQLTVKSICPEQNVRLHKSGNRTSFGWQDGIPMRTLDAKYITPALRQYDLLKLNAFGFMMTRTLAENYPYSKVYKAAIKGGREHWLQIVEGAEDGDLPARPALQFLLSQLLNNAADFRDLAQDTLDKIDVAVRKRQFGTIDDAVSLFETHMRNSQYAARIMEISMHALMQSLDDLGGLGDCTLKPLSQMRSANKKHGNIGDVELKEGATIVASWDAKYGKSYLRDEIEELVDKIDLHPSVRIVGFVTSSQPDLSPEIIARIKEVEEITGICLNIEDYRTWAEARLSDAKSQAINETQVLRGWIIAYAETLVQRRSDVAPIDEPCFQWVKTLRELV
jgi:hypothetical protein